MKTLTTNPQRRPEPLENEPTPKVLCTPYIKGLSERIENIFAPLGVKLVFKPKRTLRQELMRVKTRTPEEKLRGVVYKVPCSDFNAVYVGETKRTLKVRLSEHRQAVKSGNTNNGIAVHVQDSNHTIDWKGATVEKRVSGYWQRRTEEAIEIRRMNPNMNLDRGLLLPKVWTPILNQPPPHARPHC